MNPYVSSQLAELLRHVAQTARTDPDAARQVREAVLESGLLEVFVPSSGPDLLDLLDAGGEDALRARLRTLSVPELRQLIASHGYDPENTTARSRSANKLMDLIVTKATEQLDEEAAKADAQAAAWML